MRTLYRLILINIGFALTSCAAINAQQPITHPQPVIPITQPSPKSSDYIQPPSCPAPIKKITKNPLAVSLYSDDKNLKQHYKVIGTSSVSKYNMVGIKRQEAIIQDHLRKIAASMGGDAVINLIHNNRLVTGTVVSYEDSEENKKV